MRIENAFEVPAPPATAWQLLNDVPRVVPCLPGAQLDEVVGEDAFKVTVHVKLGAVALRLATDVERERSDPAAWITVLAVDARDHKGRGGARATIRSTLEPIAAGTRVVMAADIQMRGTLASIGRGVVGTVATELVDQFAGNLASLLHTDQSVNADARWRRAGTAGPAAQVAGPAPVGGLRLLMRALLRRLRLGGAIR